MFSCILQRAQIEEITKKAAELQCYLPELGSNFVETDYKRTMEKISKYEELKS